MSETKGRDLAVRCASAADANAIGQLLHDFNREYDDPTPGPSVLAERIGRLMGAAGTVVVVGGPGPDGLAVLRFVRISGVKASSATWRSFTWFPAGVGRDWGVH